MTVLTHAETLSEHYWQRTQVRGANECWPWLGHTDTKGYAIAKFRGNRRKASQVAWEVANGQRFPEGKMACHSCDNPSCVNPAHIWPGTALDNMRDMIAKGRKAEMQKSACPRGHLYAGSNLQMDKNGARRCRTCTRENSLRRYRENPEHRLRCVNVQRAKRGLPPASSLDEVQKKKLS